MCRDPEDARDVLQDTLFTMARQIRDFRGASSMSTWLYAIARSFCVRKRRRSRFAPAVERSIDTDARHEVADVTDPSKNPHDALADRQVHDALGEAIAELAPKYREVLLLRDVEGLTAPEVAEVLGLSVQAVKSRLHRARLEVRARLAPWLDAPAATRTMATPTVAPCPDVLARFSQYLEGDIAPNVCTEMEQHLASCDACRGLCDSLKRTLALCRTMASDEPLPASVQASVRMALKDLLVRNG
jgi:RNA polymerase sigma-70 factor (ECF subfamily)